MKNCQEGKTLLKTVRIYFSVILCMTIIILYRLNVYAASKYDFDGNGMQYDPYLISSYEDLCTLRDIVDAGDTLNGIYFRQTKDICFPDGDTWNPIGDLSAELAFYGYYDGNGHTISAIYCEDPYAGLFSFLAGTVRNLGIESGTIRGNYAGSITSHGTGNAQIINCYNKADVIADGRAGGIADNFPGLLMFCINMGNVRGGEYAENIPTAGLISYGNPYIAYCYDAGNGKLVNDSTFWGKIIESDVFSLENAETIIDDIYKHMWEVYSADGALPDSDKNVPIKRGNTVFMRWTNGTFAFDAEYEPDLFRTEKEKNKKAFLSVYNTRFDYEGSGTKENPFQIASYEDLCRLRDCVDIGVTYENYCFVQTTDIHFPSDTIWDPIGNVSESKDFRGVYDGKGHCLCNIYSKDENAGFFALLNGEVRNLGIESGMFEGNYVGSFTSHGGIRAKIINCYNKADVIGENRAGGLTDNYSGAIILSWNLGKVSGTQEETKTAGITSCGSATIEYCNSTEGILPINTEMFNGSLVESNIIADKNAANILTQNYYKYVHYSSDKVLNLNEIIFLIWNNGTLQYDSSFIPREITEAKMQLILPEIFLLCVCIFLSTMKLLSYERDCTKRKEENGIVSVHKQEYTHIKPKWIALLLTAVFGSVFFSVIMGLLNSKNTAGILNMKYWEKSENQNTDILFMGSSTMSVNIEQAELWEKYGLAGYCLGGGGMSMYDCYYRLVEGEKIHNIDFVVIDVRGCSQTENYGTSENQTENVSGLKWSVNKLKYVRAAIQPEQRTDYFLEFPLYHDRYNELLKWDYLNTSSLGEKDKGTWTIFYGNPYSPTLEDGKDVTSYRAINSKEEYYLRQTIQYCQSHDINLLMIRTPDADRIKNQPYYNSVEIIAEEYGVPFLDFNLHDKEIELTSGDFYYDTIHLNVEGARKCADFLGDYLITHYDLVNHHGDDAYKSWDQFTANREDLYMRVITDKDDYISELARDKKTVMAVPYRISKGKSEALLLLQDQLQSVQHFDWDKEDKLYGKENTESFVFGDNQLVITKDYNSMEIVLNDEDKINVSQPGLLLFIYDNVNDEIADIVEFEQNNNYMLKHLYQP